MNDPIEDKAPKPPGLLPKNVQSFVIVGIAVLMVAIMWLTGGKKPVTAKTITSALQPPVPSEVNEAKIADLQNRIEELQKEQLAAQSALAQESRLLGSNPSEPQPASSTTQVGASQSAPAEDLKAEQRRREYLSRFASNVALSYRKDLASNGTGAAKNLLEQGHSTSDQNPETLALAQLLKEAPPALAQQAPIAGANTSNSAQPPAPTASAASSHSINSGTGKTYILFEGTILEATLITRLDGHFSGPIECLLASDVYSHDRQHLLIPAGAKILGETKKVETFGQTRLAVAFHRLIMPDGYSVTLDQFKGLDQGGDTGLRDQVNNHYLRIFGTSLAIGALGAVSEAGTNGSLTASGTDLMRQGFAASSAQSATQILDRFLNVLPAITIREGQRIKVYLSGDLALPDYKNHTMPSDL